MSIFLCEENRDSKEAAKFKNEYKNAELFPRFISTASLTKRNSMKFSVFPDLSKKDTTNYEDDIQVKFGSKGERFFGEKTKALMHYLT